MRRQAKTVGRAQLLEGCRLALDVVVSHRLRSTLVILGVSIGVATLMGMVAILSGLKAKLVQDVRGGDTPVFSVTRFDPFEHSEDQRARKHLTAEDAKALERLREIDSVDIEYGTETFLRKGERISNFIFVRAASTAFQKFEAVDLDSGRFFTESEVHAGKRVCVLSKATADQIFPYDDPLGQTVRFEKGRFEVVGVFKKYDSLFGAMFESFAVVPYTTYERVFKQRWESARLHCIPRSASELPEAVASARAVMRVRHNLRPRDEDDFNITTSDAAMDFLGKITGPMALVLTIIASIGLMVGGIGVLIIMLVSVTERTSEIGVRKALGATRREILWQFLIEAATLTLAGGGVGIAAGLGLAKGATNFIAFPFVMPLGWVLVAVAVSAGVGLVFGLYPANRAARLDPIAALRYE